MAVAAMPALLAEVFLDVFIVSVFYRRLRLAARGTLARRRPSQDLVVGVSYGRAFFPGGLGVGNCGTRMPLDSSSPREIMARIKHL